MTRNITERTRIVGLKGTDSSDGVTALCLPVNAGTSGRIACPMRLDGIVAVSIRCIVSGRRNPARQNPTVDAKYGTTASFTKLPGNFAKLPAKKRTMEVVVETAVCAVIVRIRW